jgi:hypothetical protein
MSAAVWFAVGFFSMPMLLVLAAIIFDDSNGEE